MLRGRSPAYPTTPQQPAASWPVYYFAELQPVVLSGRMQRSQSAPTRSLDEVLLPVLQIIKSETDIVS